MRSILTFSLLLLLSTHMLAQKHDNWWLIGYEGGNQSPLNDEFGLAMFDFSDPSNVKVLERQQYNMNFDATASIMSDSAGNLLFYSNGEKIYAKNHQLMQNGNGIISNPDGYGYDPPQGVIALNWPGHPNKYILLNQEDNTPTPNTIYGQKLYYQVIDMAMNNGLGKVIDKNKLLLEAPTSWGQVSAVKHANGRDWWFIVPKSVTAEYYIGLITPDTIMITGVTGSNESYEKGIGHLYFTPDGKKCVSINGIYLDQPFRIDVYDFDRCSGTLTNPKTHHIDNTGYFQGISISRNSRYLYVFNGDISYQLDLNRQDMFDNIVTVAEFDGFISGVFPCKFYGGQIGPDGRIYVNSWASLHMHTIRFPDRYAEECGFTQHNIYHYVYSHTTIPNFPNYRLGPIDGSPCDTLGIDNHPLANFRYELEDSTEYRRVTFTDLSDYEPDTWHWDFGDGTTSQDTSPVHLYAQDGIYTVCLRVSNAFSADTLCRVVNIGVLPSNEPANKVNWSISPNPATTHFILTLPQGIHDARLSILDLQGRVLREENITSSSQQVSTEGLSNGTYFLRLSGEVTGVQKLMILR